MKFLAVFAALVAVACGYPTSGSWTLQQVDAALQDPATNPALIPYLEQALNQIMDALFAGENKPTVNLVIPNQPESPAGEPGFIDVWPVQVPQEPGFIDVWPIQNPGEQPGFIDVWPIQTPGEEPGFIDVWPIQNPGEEPGFIDVWPIQTPGEEPGFIDVWPIQTPEAEVASPAAPAPPAPSSPLVQIIVNVQGQQVSDAGVADVTPVQVIDDAMLRH